MADFNAASDNESSRLSRLFQARWLLIGSGLLCALFAWLEPERASLAFAGFAALVGVALFFPRRTLAPPVRGAISVRRQIWPGTSIKAITEALGYPAYVLDADAVLRYANARAEAAFGPARAGDPISYKFRRPEIMRLIEDAVSSGARAELEYREQVPQERWYAVSVSPIPLAPAARQPQFFLLSFFDLTEAKRSEQMRSDFIANASHELRTPLASLRGFIETIQGPAAKDPENIARFLGLMLEQAERMSRLIDDLLSLSRIEMKSHMRPQTIVDLAELLRQVVNMLEPLAANLGVSIELSVSAKNLPVRGDRDELIQVAENLVENACKYGQSGKRVEVNAKILPSAPPAEHGQVEVSIRDFGPGIAAEHLPRLTERFYRVDIASSREKQGTGLGLAIVKHILNRHSSRLAVTSVPGEGATFSFRLPFEGEAGGKSKNNY
ncbi:MAG: PAS domain-containing protein [Nitratireductor sp.]|nr:PAS domain-containing protein [Nitratireductor sp.]